MGVCRSALSRWRCAFARLLCCSRHEHLLCQQVCGLTNTEDDPLPPEGTSADDLVSKPADSKAAAGMHVVGWVCVWRRGGRGEAVEGPEEHTCLSLLGSLFLFLAMFAGGNKRKTRSECGVYLLQRSQGGPAPDPQPSSFSLDKDQKGSEVGLGLCRSSSLTTLTAGGPGRG